jgi:hypothetical protein
MPQRKIGASAKMLKRLGEDWTRGWNDYSEETSLMRSQKVYSPTLDGCIDWGDR